MSENTFALKVNDAVKEIKSVETRNLLKNVLTVDTLFSESLNFSLNATDSKNRKYSDFYADALIAAGSPDDVFELTLTSAKGVTVGTATRQVIYNRLVTNAKAFAMLAGFEKETEYSVKVERVSTEEKETKSKSKGDADVI